VAPTALARIPMVVTILQKRRIPRAGPQPVVCIALSERAVCRHRNEPVSRLRPFLVAPAASARFPKIVTILQERRIPQAGPQPVVCIALSMRAVCRHRNEPVSRLRPFLVAPAASARFLKIVTILQERRIPQAGPQPVVCIALSERAVCRHRNEPVSRLPPFLVAPAASARFPMVVTILQKRRIPQAGPQPVVCIALSERAVCRAVDCGWIVVHAFYSLQTFKFLTPATGLRATSAACCCSCGADLPTPPPPSRRGRQPL